MGYDLDQPLRCSPVAVFDLETTGSTDGDRICEIGVVVIDRLYETEPRMLINELIDPDKEDPWQGTRVHGIRASQVRRARGWDVVWPEVAAALASHVPCAYNAGFDLRYLRLEASNICSSLAVPSLEEALDPLPLVKRLDVAPKGKGKGHHSLSSACERRLITKGEHRAGGDALATAKLLIRLIGEVYRKPELAAPPKPTIRQWIAWQRGSAPTAAGSALPLQCAAKAAPIEEEAARSREPSGARLCWAVRGTRGHLALMFLAKGASGIDNKPVWTISPTEPKVRLFETETLAREAARRVEGEAVYLSSRARGA